MPAKKKQLSEIGWSHAQSIWILDNFAEMGQTLAAQGLVPEWYADGLRAAVVRTHSTAADVCKSQGFELPVRPATQGGGGPGTK